VNIAAILSIWAGTICMNATGYPQEQSSSGLEILAEEMVAGQNEPQQIPEQTADLPDKLKEHAKEIGETLNQDQTIQDVSAGILEPIYSAAEYMAFDSFYWVAFALMIAGVVSFAGQILFAKFFLLFKFSLNFKEIMSDLLGLLISIVGLVLTTQAATQNSTFAENSAAVVSAAVVGAIVGFVFYWWGQGVVLKLSV